MSRTVTVLLVDDEEFNLRVARIVLQRQGYQVVTARNGGEALARVAEQRPDLILLDLLMPVLDGFGTLEVLKADVALCEIPVIVLSAFDDSETLARVRRAGAAAHLSKPLSISVLEGALARLAPR